MRKTFIIMIVLVIMAAMSITVFACSCPPVPPCYYLTSGWPTCNIAWSCSSGQTCCNGSCCGGNCQSCSGGSCKVCDNDPNKQCCGNTCYRPDANESCCDGKTKYNYDTKQCCGNGDGHTCDVNQFCCYGGCCPPEEWCCSVDEACHSDCNDTEPTGHCDTSYNKDEICPGCAGLILGPRCGDITFREYTGNINHSCTGGCPGECAPQEDVLCYTEYECSEEYMRPGVCSSQEGAPGGVACMSIDPIDPYVFCVPCKKDTSFANGEDSYVIHRACAY